MMSPVSCGTGCNRERVGCRSAGLKLAIERGCAPSFFQRAMA
jgi:hypothetical protein